MTQNELRELIWAETTELVCLARNHSETGSKHHEIVETLVDYAEEHRAWQPMDLPAVEALIMRVGQLTHTGACWASPSWVHISQGDYYLLTVDDQRWPPNDMGYYTNLTFSSPAMWQRVLRGPWQRGWLGV